MRKPNITPLQAIMLQVRWIQEESFRLLGQIESYMSEVEKQDGMYRSIYDSQQDQIRQLKLEVSTLTAKLAKEQSECVNS